MDAHTNGSRNVPARRSDAQHRPFRHSPSGPEDLSELPGTSRLDTLFEQLRRVTRADVDFASPAKVQAFMSSLQQGRTEAVEPGRMAIIERISEAFDFPRVQSVVVRGVMRGMATQINPHLPPSERLTDERLDELIRQQSVQNTGLKRLFVTRLAFAYKSVADDDLRAYADFLESEAGRWNTDCLMRGAAAAAESIAQNMAAEIIRAIAQSPRSRR
jgi:hypothetical protein